MLGLTFAALGVALPPLIDLSDAAALAPFKFSPTANWLVPGRVLLGRYPTSGRGSAEARVAALREEALIDTFVCLQSELPPQDSGAPNPSGFEPYAELAAASRPESPPHFAYFGIDDMRPADSLEALAEACHDLKSRVDAKEVLYIHCWGGRGRTGIVAACLLGLLYEGMSADEALDRVQAYFATRAPGNPSPETEPQRQQVRDFYYAGYNEARPG